MIRNLSRTKTIGEIVKGSPLSYLETQILLGDVLGLTKSQILANSNRPISSKEQFCWERVCSRATNGVPVAYLTNRKEFYGWDFYVDSGVLIPRPETEKLVELAIDQLLNSRDKKGLKALEIGTGSGCVVISLIKELEITAPKLVLSSKFTATDLSAKSIQVAKQNANRHKVAAFIEFKVGDLFEPVVGEKFDLIMANLPYLSSNESRLNHFEPRVALEGGELGRELIERLLAGADEYLSPTGVLLYEEYGGKIKKHRGR